MINPTSDIVDSIQFAQRFFQIIVALAVGEAFKQFVADGSKSAKTKPDEADKDDHIYRDRLPALLSLMAIIIPFFHGMNRYFYLTYLRKDVPVSEHYALQLLFDTGLFLTEAAMFFILSRALVLSKLKKFLTYIIVLLIVDSLWTSFASLSRDAKEVFIILNIVIIIACRLCRKLLLRPRRVWLTDLKISWIVDETPKLRWGLAGATMGFPGSSRSRAGRGVAGTRGRFVKKAAVGRPPTTPATGR